MDIELINKIDDLINALDSSFLIKKLDLTKKSIYSDSSLRKLLDEYKKETENHYSSEKLRIKKELIDNPKISEYRSLEQELYLLTLTINKKLKSLVNEKSCVL